MGEITFSIPRQLISAIQENFRYKNFIETGTYMGATSIWASSLFEDVFTIEVNPKLSSQAAMFANGKSNIRFIHGDSSTELGKVSEKLEGSSLYWLDGHWCGGVEKLTHECPLIHELTAINKKEQDIILIDDARFFMGIVPPPHKAEEWPRIDEVVSLLKFKYPSHEIIIEYDIIMCLPQAVFGRVQELIREGRLSAVEKIHQVEQHPAAELLKSIIRNLHKILVNLKRGSKFFLSSFNVQHRHPIGETETPSMIASLPINTLIDVGASMGDFIGQMKTVKKDLIVYAFEPIPSVYNQLTERFRSDTNCTCYNFAVGDQDGTVQFHANDYTYSSSVLPMTNAHLKEFPYTRNVSMINCEMRRLDSVLHSSNLQKPIFIKIDVQGFELQVLNGARDILLNADYVLIEVSFVQLYEGQPLFDEINSHLNQLGLFYSGNVEQLISKSNGKILQADALYCRRKN